MSNIRKIGRFAVNMDLLQTVRQWVLCVAIVLLVAFVKPFPVVMAIGSLLGIFYVALEWRRISWRDWWPLVLLVLFYLVAVLNIRGELDPNMHHNTNWAELQLGFALVPFMFVGLRPLRRWGATWVLSTVAIFTIALIVATAKSFQMVDGAIRFIPYSLSYYGVDGFDAWRAIRAGYSFFTYEGLTRAVKAWPMYLSFCCLLSLLVVLHRLFKEKTKRWLRILLCFYMLIGMYLCNARMIYLALMVVGGLLFCRMLVKRSYRPVPLYAVIAAVIGVIVLFLVGSRGGIVRVESSEEDTTNTSAFRRAFEGMVLSDYRVNLWIRTWQERDAFLPWGKGSGAAGEFIQKHYYEKYGDVVGGRYEDVVDRKNKVMVKMHNMFVDTAVEQGYPGMLYLLFMLFLPFARLKRLKFVHVLAYVSLLVFISFESIVYSDFAIFYFCMIYCAIIAYSVPSKVEVTAAVERGNAVTQPSQPTI